MKNPVAVSVAVVSVLALAICGVLFFTPTGQPPVVTVSPDRQPHISWHPCDSSVYSEVNTLKCGHFYPAGASGTFALPFVIFIHGGHDRQLDPLVYIAGGPGAGMQTGEDNLQSWAYWLEEANLKRDLIIFDQRGLKPGKPYWDCDSYNKINKDLLAANLTLEQEYQMTQPVLQRCLLEFDTWLRSAVVGAEAGLKSFSSLAAAEDLYKMLTLLGYHQWNLWGVSYGSRLALVTAQQAPTMVRSIVLDSPYPVSQGRLSEKPAIYAQALARFWHICRTNSTVCGVNIDDPEALFWRVVDRLSQQPESYRVRQPDGTHVSVVLNDHRFFSLLLFALYDERFYPDVAQGLLLLDRDKQTPGDDPILRLLRLFIASVLDSDFNSMVFFAIECNDNQLETADVYDAAAAEHPLLKRFTRLEENYNPCKSSLFTPEALLSSLAAPVAPTLIVSGELDPVTPVTWAETLARQLPEVHLIVVPDAGHALIRRGVCDSRVLNQFLDQPLVAVSGASLSCF